MLCTFLQSHSEKHTIFITVQVFVNVFNEPSSSDEVVNKEKAYVLWKLQ